MKKYLFICLAMLSVAFIWARDAEFANADKFDIKADATVSWGIDLGKGTGDADDRYQTHGFKNQHSWEVKFPIFKKGTNTSARSEDAQVYGEIILKNIELAVISKQGDKDKDFKPTGKVENLEAKFVFFGVYLQVYNAPSFKTNYANFWAPIVKESYYHKDAYKFEPGWDAYGMKLGYKNDKYMGLDVSLKVGSNNTWDPANKTVPGDAVEKIGRLLRRQIVSAPVATSTIPKGERWIKEDGSAEFITSAGGTVPAGNYFVYEREISNPEKKIRDPSHSKYALGLDFSMKPLGKKLEFGVTFNTLFDPAQTYEKGLSGGDNLNKEKVYMNTGAQVKSEPIDNLKLKFGFDGGWGFESSYWDAQEKKEKKPDVFAWDMLFDASYKWISTGLYVSSEGTPTSGGIYRYIPDRDIKKRTVEKETADIGMYVKFETKADKNDASCLLENLNAGAYVGMYDLITTANAETADGRLQLPLAMKLWANYKIGIGDTMWVKPFFEFYGETNRTMHTEYDIDRRGISMNRTTYTADPYFGIAYKLGITYQPVEKVELTAQWDHGKTQEKQYFMIASPANHNNHRGTFVLSCKVSW